MDDNRGRDRISKLPDDILHCILSLLDMKQMVQTSILSSRWRYLWISMPSFNFNLKVFQSCKTVNSNSYRFVKFVDMVLQSKTSMQTLVLSYVSNYSVGSGQVYKWIVDAVRLNVSVLKLKIEYDYGKIYPLMLPLCLFTCKTLTTLKLDMGYLSRNTLVLSLPDSSVCLTALKTLHLSWIRFIGEENTDSFFSRCPVLETLSIFNCQFKEAYKTNYLPSSILSCETLVSLKLKMFFMSTPIFNSIPDSVILPSLKCLHLAILHLFSGETTANLFFSSCPSLESLILDRCKLHVDADVLPRYVFTCKTLVKLNVMVGCSSNKVSDCSFNISSFFCKSLTKLVLKTGGSICYRDTLVSLPDSMSLPALKTLHLQSLILKGKDSITNLLTSCPILESLTIMQCAFDRVNLNIYSHKLRHLKLVNDKSSGSSVSIYAPKGEQVKCFFDHYNEVKINAPNLTSFICIDYMSKVYTIDLLKLPEDKKQTYATEKEKEKQLYAQQMMKILGGVYNVKVLILSAWFLEVVSEALDLPDSPTIQFCNLKTLKLRTWRTMDCAHAVMYLLERSPNIESLSVKFAEIPLSSPFFEKNPAGKRNWEERLALNCMLHHLTSVKLKDFSGCYPELKFVEFLLKNAMNLQKLMIRFVTIKDPKSNAECRVVKVSEEEVLSLPRASSSVEILFMSL